MLFGAISFVFMVIPFGFSRFGRQGDAGFLGELHGLLIHANDRNFRIIGTLIYGQYVLHSGYEVSILFRGNDPAFS